jgi:endonuclease/exonuclease/phosphatase family metal-dependent hydrolase
MTQMLLVAAVLALIGNTVVWAAEPLVASGGFVRNPPEIVPSEFRILTYNLHGPPDDHMDELVDALRSDPVLKEAAIFGLQEVNRHHRKTGYRDVASELATTLGLYYAFAVENPYKKGGGERGLAILSRFPISQVERIALPHAGPGGRRRIALGTTVHLGPDRLRVYSIHLETRIANRKHADQLTAVVADANRYRELPTVILGDFNTVYFRTEQTFDLLKASDFQTKLYEGSSFRKALLLRKKLDWIWTRNLEIFESGVQGQIEVSDHRPIWAQLRWRSQPNAARLP